MNYGDKIRVSKMKNKIIGYIRTSTDRQNNSVKLQTHQITDYCEKNNLFLNELIVDEGLSGKDIKNRVGYHRIMEMVEKKEVDTLIVLSLSRWGRNLKQCYESVEVMIQTDTKFISLKENFDLSSPIGRFQMNLFNGLYQMEREIISDRVSDILMDKKMSGKVYGVTPYGFDRDGDFLLPNTKEKKVLKKIHSFRDKGTSYQKISDFLNRNKHNKKNGKKWTRYDVFHIIRTERIDIGVKK